MDERLIEKIPRLPEPAAAGIGDRLRQLPGAAREHAGKVVGATLAGVGIGLVAPALPISDVIAPVSAAEAGPADTYSTGSSLSSLETNPEADKSAEKSRITGYWMLSGHGFVMSFGDAEYHGSGPDDSIGIAASPTGNGYWIAKPNGVVLAYGDATLHADAPGIDRRRGEIITTVASAPNGEEGFWTASSLGRVFNYGSAGHFGDLSGTALNQPIKRMVPTPTGKGYWLLGADGGVFTFGDAEFHGSTGDMRLNQPIIDMMPDADGDGYWLLGADGGVFSFDADFRGSTGAMTLNQPIVGGMTYGDGYAFVARDGGIFIFGKQPFMGSGADNPHAFPIVAAAIKKG